MRALYGAPSRRALIKEFPVDALKIDRSFINGVLTNNLDAAIATTVIELAHNLGLEVVAEGVEDEKQMDWLNDRACDAVQGFLICKPVTAEALVDWLNTESPRSSDSVANRVFKRAARGALRTAMKVQI